MKKNLWVQIMATLALLGIILSIAGTAIVIIFDTSSNTPTQQDLTPEQLEELQKILSSQTGALDISTGALDSNTTEDTTNK